jgi:hypothetical protein
MIQDKSADFEETWSLLSRRIEDVSQFISYLHQSGEASQVAKEAVTAAFITVCHILTYFVYIVMLYNFWFHLQKENNQNIFLNS